MRTLTYTLAGAAIGAMVTVGAFAYGTGVTSAPTPDASAPVIAQCVETVHSDGTDTVHDCTTAVVNVAAAMCARAAFLADDYAHTHTGARHERRAVRRCAAMVGGF